MAEIQYIKYLYESEGKSLREISKIVGMNFRTVQKYAYMNNFSPQITPNVESATYPVLGAYIPIIDEWLEQDLREPRKQRHTAKHIHRRLTKEKGFSGSYSSVKRYVVRKKWLLKQAREGFLPLKHPLASAQVDFGKFKFYDSLGRDREGHALVVSFPNANAGWMQVFPSENQECLLTGLQRIFYHIGGVPVRVRCDNMSTAVAQILKGTERVITDGFYRFMLHHRFEADFCNPDSGNEKGSVENKVGYTRRNMLVPVPVIDDFKTFNEELFRRCDDDHGRPHYLQGRLIRELWDEERKHLLKLPEYVYEVFRYDALSPDKYGFVTVDKSKYGLSPQFYGRVIQAKIFCDAVELYYDHQLLKTYARNYGERAVSSDWKDYLPTLVKKPGATEHTRFFNQMPKLWQQYLSSISGRERKSALTLLAEIVADGNEALCEEALELAGEHGPLSSDNIRACYLFISKPERNPRPLSLAGEPPRLNYRPDLSVYDSLTGGAVK